MSSAPHEAPAPQVPGPSWDTPFSDLAPAHVLRAFGVDYVHVRPPEGGDLYTTRFGWPHVRQLMPSHWYADEWYAKHGLKLPGGSGHVYRVQTRPEAGPPCDMVVKFSRMAQEVSIVVEGTMPDYPPDRDVVAEARFNSPMEEFGLVMSLRRGLRGPADLRLLTQRPLAIYAPPGEHALWELGRSDCRFFMHHHTLEQDQTGAQWAIELDIRRVYVMLYSWIKGMDAEDCHRDGLLTDDDLRAITPRVTGELAQKGFCVIDNKPKHYILRPRDGGRGVLRDRRGRPVYGLIDFEFLKRTKEGESEYSSEQRERFWTLRQRASEVRAGVDDVPRPGAADAVPVRLHGTEYLFSHLADGGKLWLRGADPGMNEYFLPDRWRRTPRVKLSDSSQVFRTRTRDGLHIIYRLSRCGLRPHVDPLTRQGVAIRQHGFNSPFEEVAIAELLRPLGIPTAVPLAIYRTAHQTTKAAHLRDARRFEEDAGLLTPENPPEPALSADHDYYTIWQAFRGLLPARAASDPGPAGVVDLDRAREDGWLTTEECLATLEDGRRRLLRRGLPAQGITAEDLVVLFDAEGRVRRDANGVAVLMAIDALTAYEFALIDDPQYRAVLRRVEDRLRAADFEKLDPNGRHLLLAMDPDGRFERESDGGIRTVLANFSLIRRLYRRGR